jgi:hypothetical protein
MPRFSDFIYDAGIIREVCSDKMGCRQLPLFVQTFEKGLDKDKIDAPFCPNDAEEYICDWYKVMILWITLRQEV